MSAPQPYQIDYGADVLEQIETIKSNAKKAERYPQFIEIMKKAIQHLETDPHGWGDPEYHAKTVDAIAYRGIIRPVVFQYVIYEQVHGVVLVKVKQFTDFA